mmetsp:Transcript_45633/g.74397  ORF Transcript_45633/g.74397 Transcript_45633/m.74397 type:complete len:234 (-) Transcript_45633:130-831(-)|eukprot:CAMPEP_0184644702 /NCGR_PEP_ID=MMETSP0308-20130426/1381_1 /TAXON_ID=38269 /ORGANISM="Gloeochaete witrockiana, Strain SAG 46.84" /LENGTH=233 /DNA_ID=CAMNT_0027073387 /DNA_START=158 /DNA_END=859 /DNA_ORIENTATION=+
MADIQKEKSSKPRGPGPIGQIYLIVYNLSMTAGWTLVLALAIEYLISHKTNKGLWRDIELPLKIFQTGAIFEILHAATGLVRSNVASTFLQVFSRVGVLWGIANIALESRESVFFPIMIISWSLSEVPRYLFYAMSLFNTTPSWLKWMRYSLFAILYPTGITGELGVSIAALAMLKTFTKYNLDLPNPYNIQFNYYYFTLFLLLLYIPGSPYMYMHMVSQRKKALAADSKKTE